MSTLSVNAVVPRHVLDVLKCCTCREYLSVGPFWTLPGGFQCGRCKPPNPEGKIIYRRAVELECFAQLSPQLFPCKFDALGCKHAGRFNEIWDHELTCEHRTIKCPALDSNCDKELLLGEVVDHFRTDHWDCFLESPTFVLRDDMAPKNYVLVLNNYPFLLHIIKSGEADNCFELVLRSLDYLDFNRLCYGFEAPGKFNSVLIRGKKITGYKEDFSRDRRTEFVEIDLNSIEPGESSSEIKVVEQFDHLELIKEVLSCPVCKEVMHPPIYSCATGHSICCLCKIKLNACPVCEKVYLVESRNFAVESFVSKFHYLYDCRFKDQGCIFFGKSNDMSTHENMCTYRPTYCPAPLKSKCDWKGSRNQIYSHLKSHSFHVVKLASLKCYQWFSLGDEVRKNKLLLLDDTVLIVHDNNIYATHLQIFTDRVHLMIEQCTQFGTPGVTEKTLHTFKLTLNNSIPKSPNIILDEILADDQWRVYRIPRTSLLSLISSKAHDRVSCTLFVDKIEVPNL